MDSKTLAVLCDKVVVIIGPNGVGKSTQFGLLISFLEHQGLKFDHFKSPNMETESGKFIKKVMTDLELRTKMGTYTFQLHLADLFIKHEVELQKRVDRNKLNKVFTAREDCIASTEGWVRTHLGISSDGLIPQDLAERMQVIPEADLVIILDGERHLEGCREKGHVNESDESALDRYQEIIISLAKRKAPHFRNSIIIDANGTIEEVHQRIVSGLTEYVISLAT